jgi:imidazolonepropionase-like amidohydrolase
MPKTFVRCRWLFIGLEDAPRSDQTFIVEGGLITHVGPSAEAPRPAEGDAVLDAGEHFVMPGLVDVHTHLAFGNARS